MASDKGRAFQPGKSGSQPKMTPSTVSVVLYDPPKDTHPEDEDSSPAEPSKTIPLKVKHVNLNVPSNTKNHQTEQFEMTQAIQDGNKDVTRQLVVRRSQEFTISVTFDREYNTELDDVRFILEFGDKPVVSKQTLIRLKPDRILQQRHWSASVQSLEGAKLTVAILTPPDCFIGKWRLAVESSLPSERNGGKMEVQRYAHPETIYMLFNPFSRDDTVYLDNEIERDEYVLNETGKIYNGNQKQISAKPWVFGQFENPVLECAMKLLDMSRLNRQSRGNPVAIVRAISGIVNALDDNGVLEGNWSGQYEDGVAPSHWTGSVPILQKFHETGKSVKYGQCWVFAGVTASVCRALGLPTRCVTNYSSAHDCDGSISLDVHWDDKGQPIHSSNEESVWNFHVWNEAWMTRPDLIDGYGGWQVFDATPQETSMGFYCSGPTSTRAIREGNVNFPYDGAFTFAEVNADKVHWILGKDGEWTKVIQKNVIGKKISTKRPRNQPKPPRNRLFNIVFKDDEDRLDITDDYKYPEGTEAERAAVLKANTFSTRSDIYDKKDEDVKFELAQKDDILVGNPFDVILKIINKSREKRSVHVVITIDTAFYTGRLVRTLKTREFNIELQPIKTEEAVMRVLAEEYLTFTVDQASFNINVLAEVAETDQKFADSDVYRLRRPDLEIECPASVTVGKPFDAKIRFQNSLPEHLTACEWMVEGPGLQKPKTYKHKNLEPYDPAELKVTLTPLTSGHKQLVASFTSKELTDVTGLFDIEVKP